MHKIICVSGMTGSGKAVVADYLSEKGYQFLRFGQTILDEVKKRKLKPTEAVERRIRESFRKKYGMAAIAILNYPKIKTLLKKGPVVIDGLYSWSEYKYLKSKFGEEMTVIAVFAPPKLRYRRLSKRKISVNDKNLRMRPLTQEKAESRDYAEIENLEKGGPIAMADYTLVNTAGKDFLKKQIDAVMIDLGSKLL